MALAQLGRPDEASETGALALESGNLVPSNLWQAAELDAQLMRDCPTRETSMNASSSLEEPGDDL